MKNIFLVAISLLMYNLVSAQVIYDKIESQKLKTSRQLKIQLPRNYDKEVNKKYPIILVMDGDYLFEPVAGDVDYYSYWEDMPPSIVVGIMQGDGRYQDCAYDDMSYMPSGSGADFFEFIGMELLPYLMTKYRSLEFIVGVGHDFTANFINYFMFKEPVLFNGYINLSPDFSPMMKDRIIDRIPSINENVFYYLATGTNDNKALKESSEDFDRQLNSIRNKSFHYYFDNFADATHYSLVGRAIPNALEKIFSVYRPISNKEFSDVLMKPETSTYQYLLDRYKMIEDLFGIKDNIDVNDFLAVAAASEKKKDWESLRKIGDLAKKQYPNKVIGDYFIGRFYEETGNPKKAMRTFQGAYGKEEVDFITTDLLLDRADKIKQDFGY